MALAILSPLSVEEKLAFLATFTASISGSGSANIKSGKAAASAAPKKAVKATKKIASSDDEDESASTTSSQKKREATPQFKADLEARNIKIKNLRAADPELSYHDAMREAALLMSMEKLGLTRDEAEAKQAESKAKRSSKKGEKDESEVAPKEPKAKSAPKPKAEKKPAVAAATAAPSSTALLASASTEDLEAADDISSAPKPAADKKSALLAAAAAAKAKKAAEPVYELVEGEDMETTEAMKEMGCVRTLVDGKFYYVNAESGEAYSLAGDDVGKYNKEMDCIDA